MNARISIIALVAAAVLLPGRVCASETAAPETGPAEIAAATGRATREEPDKCDQEPAQDKLPEKTRAGTFEFACRTLRWVDGLFGSSHDFREESVDGRLSLGFAWNQYEHWDPSLRFRVHTDLPNLSSRWNAFFGRVDEEDYIEGSETTQESALRRGISDSDETEWLLGLGYKGREEKTGGWDYSVGVRLRSPPRFYVRTRYEKVASLSPNLDLRYRQTFFWRDGSSGFGTTTHLDSDRQIDPDNILRWEFIAKLTEATEGIHWWLGNTWYHRLGEKRGVSLRSFARGATDAEVELLEYGLELTWRRQVAREWLFINAGPTLTWPRERREERREASLGFQVLMEMEFGYSEG